jgi:DNA polymerase IIIc chi subunit
LVLKRDQELVKLKEEKIKSNKEKTDMLIKFTDIEKKFGEEKLKVIKYIKEKEDINKSLKTTNQILEKERYKLEIAQSEV